MTTPIAARDRTVIDIGLQEWLDRLMAELLVREVDHPSWRQLPSYEEGQGMEWITTFLRWPEDCEG